MAAITSIAADRRAAGVIRFQSGQATLAAQ
jgi:hypothetical protein